MSASQRAWCDARFYLNEHRHELSRLAARLYCQHERVEPTNLLTKAEWMSTTPIPLDDVRLVLNHRVAPAEVDGSEPETAGVRPMPADGDRYETYAEAVAELARPRLFANRPCYRLLDLAVDHETATATFGIGTYFDVVSTCEAVAHELAATAAEQNSTVPIDTLPFRSLIGDPCELRRRPLLPAISALTLRKAPGADVTFVLHWRDSAKVTHGGDLYHVMPVGIFQPSAAGAWNEEHDLDLWKSLAREYSEEFLGAEEKRGHERPIDYTNWAFFRRFSDARVVGKIRGHLLGFGIDPLSLVGDLLVAVVIDHEVFDQLFGAIVQTNEEGQVVSNLPSSLDAAGIPFNEETIANFVQHQPMQPAGAAVLQLAWEHREKLLS
jgi:hypothetical protein